MHYPDMVTKDRVSKAWPEVDKELKGLFEVDFETDLSNWHATLSGRLLMAGVGVGAIATFLHLLGC